MFGLLLGPRVQRASFETRVRELVAHDALIAGVTECMLRAWAALWTEYKRLHTLLAQIVGRDELCRRFCGIPGVGSVTALAVKAAIDDPRRVNQVVSALPVRDRIWPTATNEVFRTKRDNQRLWRKERTYLANRASLH